MPSGTRKLSQIAPTTALPALTDQFVGVTGGTTDNLYPYSSVGFGGRKQLPISGAGNTFGAFASTFYIATTGNDVTGDGTIGNPWATLQFAIPFVLANYATPPGKFISEIIFQLADGTYNLAGNNGPNSNAGFYIGGFSDGFVSNPTIVIQGNVADFTKVVWNNSGVVFRPIGFWIDGGPFVTPYMNFVMQFLTLTNWGTGIESTYTNTIWVGPINWGSGMNTDMSFLWPTSLLVYAGNNQITGNRSTHIFSNGVIDFSFSPNVNLVGTPAFSGTFIRLNQSAGWVNSSSDISFTGTGATGSRFIIAGGARLEGTGSKTFFPGSVAGSFQGTGGVYT